MPAIWRGVFMGLAFDGETTLYASEGEPGRIRRIDLQTGASERWLTLNQAGYRDSFTGDLAFDAERGILYALDQANFRLAIIDVRRRRILGSIRTGRLPFALALSPDGKRAYVTNSACSNIAACPAPIQTSQGNRPALSGLRLPVGRSRAWHAPRNRTGRRESARAGRSQFAGVEFAGRGRCGRSRRPPRWRRSSAPACRWRQKSDGGSSPSGVVATADRVFVSNADNDSITVIDAQDQCGRRRRSRSAFQGWKSCAACCRSAWHTTKKTGWLLVAEAGINAVAVIDDAPTGVLGHLPAALVPDARGHRRRHGLRGQRQRPRHRTERLSAAPAERFTSITRQGTSRSFRFRRADASCPANTAS